MKHAPKQMVRRPDRVSRRAVAPLPPQPAPAPVSARVVQREQSSELERYQQGAGNAVIARAAQFAAGQGDDSGDGVLPSGAALFEATRLALQRKPETGEPGQPGPASAYDNIIALAQRPGAGAATQGADVGPDVVPAKFSAYEAEGVVQREAVATRAIGPVVIQPSAVNSPAMQRMGEEGDELQLDDESTTMPGDVQATIQARGLAVQAKRVAVSHDTRLEREADEMGSRVARDDAAVPFSVSQRMSQSPPPAARQADSGHPSSGDRPAAGEVAERQPAEAEPEVSADVDAYITSAGEGEPLPDDVRERLERHMGADLRGVRVHATPEAAWAAAQLQARAFTFGRDIFLGEGESAGDLELMAHEATHVVQQGAVEVFRQDALSSGVGMQRRDEIMRILGVDVIGWVRENVASAASAIPGYTMVTQIMGRDPISDQPVQTPREELLEALLTWGPFGEAVGPLFTAMDVLGDVFNYVIEQLQGNDLTFERLRRDLAGAWDEFSITKGVSGNIEIVRRYLSNLLSDVRSFVSSIVDRVIEIVREVIAEFVEPLLETPEIEPLWSLAKKIFHYDPLRGEVVEAPTVEILRDFLIVIGQEGVVVQMEERGTLQETADWIDTQWDTFTGILTDIGQLFTDAWDAITPANLPNLLETLPGLVQRGFAILGRILDFGATLLAEILRLVKDSLMGWLSEYAHEIPGFHLLTVILERNPFTDEPVPRTAENLIRGFISLLPGGDAMYNELAESGVIGDAASRIEESMTSLGISWEMIKQTFLGVWDLVTLENLLSPLDTFRQILDLFGEPIARIFEFIAVVIEVVITLILALMGFPTELLMNIINNAMQAIDLIMADPVQFLVNMLEAVKLGFSNFLDNIGTHLLQGLADWLFSGLSELGITLPTSLEPAAIFEFVLQVIGVDEETLWTKLAEQIGEERVAQIRAVIDTLTGIWAFVRDVQERGIVAIWDFIADQLSNLWDTILSMAKDWIMETIITRVTARLLSMLDPTGVMAVINSFLVFFDTVRSVIQYIREILAIVDMYVSTIAAVAAGNIVPGAEMLERGFAAAIPVAIGFLANIIGLGGVPQKIREIIESLREVVDRALTWLFEQAMRLGGAVLNALGIGGGGDGAQAEEQGAEGDTEDRTQGDPEQRLNEGMAELEQRLDGAVMGDGLTPTESESIVSSVKAKYGFQVLEITESVEELTLHGVINPDKNKKKGLRALRVAATKPEARLIENPANRFPREVAIAIDAAQEVMNDLYRKDGDYGDGSSAFMAMKEQFEGGVGNPPKSLKKGTLHAGKCEQYIRGLTRHLANLPPEAKRRAEGEIEAMEEALEWARDYRAGNDPAIPRWARAWKSELGK